MQHEWVERTEGTSLCKWCGCVQFHPANPDNRSVFSRWAGSAWLNPLRPDGTAPRSPKCMPEKRGHTVPEWARERATP